MDDKTYWRLFSPGSCSCGKTFGRNMLAEAFHRHNFPALCKPPKKDKKRHRGGLPGGEKQHKA